VTSTIGRSTPGRARHLTTAVLLLYVMGAGGACARNRAPLAAPSPVALNVPPPPPRVISVPPEPVEAPEVTSVEAPAPPSRPARAVRPAAPRAEAPRGPEPARPEAPADTLAAPAVTEPPPSAPLLRMPQTADESEAERRTRDVLGRARALLQRVNPRTLSQQARQQHDTARRFVAQAEQAMIERNFVLASYLADKAETLAKGLSR
jgi:periplasmic protein TonB